MRQSVITFKNIAYGAIFILIFNEVYTVLRISVAGSLRFGLPDIVPLSLLSFLQCFCHQCQM